MPFTGRKDSYSNGSGGNMGWFLFALALVVIAVLLFNMKYPVTRPIMRVAHTEIPAHRTVSHPRREERRRVEHENRHRSAARDTADMPIDGGPVAAAKDTDIYEFGFWPCRRVAAALLCVGFMRNESDGHAYQPIRLYDIKDNLGDDYRAQTFSDNGYDCMNGCSPEFDGRQSHRFALKVDEVVPGASSIILYFQLSRSSLSENYASSVATTTSISVPIE